MEELSWLRSSGGILCDGASGCQMTDVGVSVGVGVDVLCDIVVETSCSGRDQLYSQSVTNKCVGQEGAWRLEVKLPEG